MATKKITGGMQAGQK